MRLSLIVSTYNNPAPLDLIFSRLAADKSAQLHELIVADDGSGEATKAVVEKWRKIAPFAVKHAWHEDHGFRKTRILNAAVAMAEGDYVVFLDGDCLPGKHFVADHQALAERGTFVQGRRAFVREQKVAELLTGKTTLLNLALTGQIHGLLKGIRWPFPIVKRNQQQRGLIGCNLAIWRDDLLAVNGFDEAYEGWGIGEDSDLGSRLYHLGRQRKFVYGRALVFHLDHPQLNKAHVPQSLQRLQDTLTSKKIRCEAGLNQHSPAAGP
jgi:cellulose synthase/poly-beta-1,6-N-acetylglucosamine synthase-like glycosyltransferase